MTFSILGRIGGDATMKARYRLGLRLNFQYPRSDRRRCNYPHLLYLRPCTFFQYPRSDRRRCNAVERLSNNQLPPPYRILGRIGGDATNSPNWWLSITQNFQYPRSDRRRCNDALTTSILRDGLNFQYPRSDRRRCNSALAIVRSGTIHPTFSILGRIGGDAT